MNKEGQKNYQGTGKVAEVYQLKQMKMLCFCEIKFSSNND